MNRLLARLRSQAFSDSALLFLPPFSATLYILTCLYYSGWIAQLAFGATIFGLALLAVGAMAARYWPYRPSLYAVARLVDEKTAAKDRFLTLVSIEPSSCSPIFFNRLHHETGEILARVEPRRDFPYQLKPGFYRSLTASALVVVLFHLLLSLLQARTAPPPGSERLRALAQKMATRPGLSELARDLRTLATRLDDAKMSRQEKRSLIEEMRTRVAEEEKRQNQKDNRDVLGEAASTLRGLEQQQGGGKAEQEDQKQAAGGIQSNLPQEEKGEGKPKPGSGDNQGERSAQLDREMQQGKSTPSRPEGDQQTQQKQGEGKHSQPDRREPDQDKGKQTAGKAPGTEDRIGKNKASEEVPQGGPPPQRFYRPGEEGAAAIKGARYVTVQLPEEVAADSKSTTTGSKESQSSKARPKVPVSNIPLPAHVPDAPTEKQHVPLEYRGVIR